MPSARVQGQDTAVTVFIFFMQLLVTGPSTRASHGTSRNFTVSAENPNYCLLWAFSLLKASTSAFTIIKKLLKDMLNRHFQQDEGPRPSENFAKTCWQLYTAQHRANIIHRENYKWHNICLRLLCWCRKLWLILSCPGRQMCAVGLTTKIMYLCGFYINFVQETCVIHI